MSDYAPQYKILKCSDPCYPLVILNGLSDECDKIYDECKKTSSVPFNMTAIYGIDWNRDLSPWHCPAVFRGTDDFSGHADRHLSWIKNSLLPDIEKNLSFDHDRILIAGYSLAGLFALYSCVMSDIFSGCICASGSLWFPNFDRFVSENRISGKVGYVYMSLGDREHMTKNRLMSTVSDKTAAVFDMISAQTDAVFIRQTGNHFSEPEKRTARGIAHVLSKLYTIC